MQRLTVEISGCRAVEDQAVEIVERKGVGHPDYICDAALERVSVALSAEYQRTFGSILHHNIDKGLLIAGIVEKGFGAGRVKRPMELVVGDRATFEAGGRKVPVAEIATSEIKAWFTENLPHVDIDRDLSVRIALEPGSAELSGIFGGEGGVRGANDTSAAVGYAPMTPTEEVVYATERFINSADFKRDFPETGEDVKVMGIRTARELDLTIACPLMARLISSEAAYFERKAAVQAAVERFLAEASHTGAPGHKGFAPPTMLSPHDTFDTIKVNYNTLDAEGRGADGVYLSLLGTSAEDADSGQIGRGNRVNGVISLNRPMGTEAAAGKNPVSHVGKIYSVLAHRMAHEIYERLEHVREVYVWLVSQIGAPVDRPKALYVRLVPDEDGLDEATLRAEVSVVTEDMLSGIEGFIERLARGEYPVC